ncbi:hypothetical protein [Maribacter cobaltidurans]|uniref:Uncharacterized protein n=1 Tax=Maribacter cobaltidurans TaxID=1178778 RepID=A0A223VAW6_9FLAO|nr:hypothetical protein [Maribacter cobaltidurans]ASV32009.1 hypothetical protein CJ263_18300 [Maribacter cobaltidurans]GGD86442.1 hypothetical protein GCM10011412_25340 [Maribacter cobaltidurans]
MLFKPNNYHSIDFINVKSTDVMLGLFDFKKSIELGYFSEVILKNNSDSTHKLDLVVELNCPLNLLDILSHFNKGLWGSSEITKSPLAKSFDCLLAYNKELDIDIQEFTLYLNDTNIVIKNIYKHSIPEQFNNIISEIGKQYVSITKGLTEQPEEIFIPVFEDSLNSSLNGVEKRPTLNSYTEYWGIYMESEVDGLIFDVQHNKFISANLDYYMFDENN